MSRIYSLLLLLILVPLCPAQTPPPRVPEGFKVELLLEAPAIEAPTALCVAPNGDVYFAEDPMDMAGPPTRNLDRIWMLKGGDPKRKVLVAEQMWAVMGMEIVRDKLFVVHPPYVTVFTLDPDGKVASREDLFKDLGPPVAGVPGFNDHVPSGIRMGMDGWLYVSIGDKGIPGMTRKEEVAGGMHVAEGRERRTKDDNKISLEGGGVIRFRPDGSGLEVFASGTRNHLDVPLDEQDRIFVRDNTDDGDGWNTRLMYLPEGGFLGYPWAFKRHPERTVPAIRDFGGGSPCGGWVYTDDGLPESYRGRIFHCEWGKGKVLAVKVKPDGAGFAFVDEVPFMDPDGTGLKDFRPFSIRPTADGRGFYVTDWGFSGWLQKVKAGRLWKVTYVKDDVKPAPRGTDADPLDKQLAALSHPAHSERLRAQRALIALGKPASDAVNQAFADKKLSPAGRRHGLWVLRELERPAWWYLAMLESETQDDELIFNAIRVMGSYDRRPPQGSEENAFKVAGELITIVDNDATPSNRLMAAIALQRVVTPKWCRDIVYQFANEKDPLVRLALVRTLKRYGDWPGLNRLMVLHNFVLMKEAGSRDGLFAALTDEYDLGAVHLLLDLAAHPDPGIRAQALTVLTGVHHDRKPYPGTWWGTRPEQREPPARDVPWEGTPLVRQALLDGLADRAAEVRKQSVAGLIVLRDPSTLAPLRELLGKEKDDAGRVDLVRAIAGLRTEQALPLLDDLATGMAHAADLRLAALEGLAKLGSEPARATIGKVAAGTEPVALRQRALDLIGELGAKGQKDVCVAALEAMEPVLRTTAAKSLGRLGDPAVADRLVAHLGDPDPVVRTACIQSLGELRAKSAVPALLKAAAEDSTRFEAITALTKMPDPGALTAYLTGLESPNTMLRQASVQALSAVREQVLPSLEQLVKNNEVKQQLFPALRSIYASFSPIIDWRLVGPFPDDGKSYPPEKESNFDATYEGAGKQVKWQTRKGDARVHGKINLGSHFSPNANVIAYGYAEIESAEDRDAELLVGSDDTIVIWLNGTRVHEFTGNRGWAFDQEKVRIRLRKGKNDLLVKCGNNTGPWEFSVALSGDAGRHAFLKGGTQKIDLDAFRAFARKSKGDVARGERLFQDLKGLACVKCHTVGGKGGQIGPDLAGIALKYQREDLMTAVLEPSKVIAQGYETLVVETTKGRLLTGVFKGESAEGVELVDAEGKKHFIAKQEIEEKQFSPVSTMPNGLNDGMTLQDFADILAYLEARREETSSAPGGKPR